MSYLIFLVARQCASYCFIVLQFILYFTQLANKVTLLFTKQTYTIRYRLEQSNQIKSNQIKFIFQ